MREQQAEDYNGINRIIINSHYVIVILTLLGAGIGLLTNSYKDSSIVTGIISIICMLITLCIGEGVIRLKWRLSEYSGLIVCALFMTNLVIFHYEINGVQYVLVAIILYSALFYQRSKVIISTIITLLIYMMIYIFHDAFRSLIDGRTLIFTMVSYISFALLANAINQRGLSLLRKLERALAEQQQLFISNINQDMMSKMDGLTQIYNRKTVDEFMKGLEDQNIVCSFAIMDIDNFKSVNDTYGHSAGDKVLQEVARCVKSILPIDDLVSRYGGEEFAFVLFEEDFEKVQQLLESVRSEIEQLRIPELGERIVTVSIGLSQRQMNQTMQQLRDDADSLLYLAKRSGKNQVQIRIENTPL